MTTAFPSDDRWRLRVVALRAAARRLTAVPGADTVLADAPAGATLTALELPLIDFAPFDQLAGATAWLADETSAETTTEAILERRPGTPSRPAARSPQPRAGSAPSPAPARPVPTERPADRHDPRERMEATGRARHAPSPVGPKPVGPKLAPVFRLRPTGDRHAAAGSPAARPAVEVPPEEPASARRPTPSPSAGAQPRPRAGTTGRDRMAANGRPAPVGLALLPDLVAAALSPRSSARSWSGPGRPAPVQPAARAAARSEPRPVPGPTGDAPSPLFADRQVVADPLLPTAGPGHRRQAGLVDADRHRAERATGTDLRDPPASNRALDHRGRRDHAPWNTAGADAETLAARVAEALAAQARLHGVDLP